MMSKLVSDLFDISEFAHHGPGELIYFADQNYRFVHIPVSDQLETGNTASGSGSVHVVLLVRAE